jgi:chaperonin GroEL
MLWPVSLGPVKAGVLDPTKVVRTALTNAGSLASLMLVTKALVADLPEEDDGAQVWGGQRSMH